MALRREFWYVEVLVSGVHPEHNIKARCNIGCANVNIWVSVNIVALKGMYFMCIDLGKHG